MKLKYLPRRHEGGKASALPAHFKPVLLLMMLARFQGCIVECSEKFRENFVNLGDNRLLRVSTVIVSFQATSFTTEQKLLCRSHLR
jgi:hypothetical protein